MKAKTVRRLLFCGSIVLIVGCDWHSYSGRIPKSGTHPDKVNYNMRSLAGATVIPVAEIDLEKSPDEPPVLSFPANLKPGQAVAFEGQIRAPKKVIDVFVRVEFHLMKGEGEPVLSQTGQIIAESVNGVIKYRLEMHLPFDPGRHRLRLGAIIESTDEVMVGIAQGEVVLR